MHQYMHEIAFEDNEEIAAGETIEYITQPFIGNYGIVTSIQVGGASTADPFRVTIFFAGFQVFPPTWIQDSTFIIRPFFAVFTSEIEVIYHIYSEVDMEYSLLVTHNFLVGDPFMHKLPRRDPFLFAKARSSAPLVTLRKGNLAGKKTVPWWDTRTKDVIIIPVVFDSNSPWYGPDIRHYWISEIIDYPYTIVHVRIDGSHIPINLGRASQSFLGYVVRPGDPGHDGVPMRFPGGIPFWRDKNDEVYRVSVGGSVFYHRIWLVMREKNSRIVMRSTPNLGVGVPPDPFETWIIQLTLFKDFPAPHKGIRSGIQRVGV